MVIPVFAALQAVFQILLALIAIFLILLVLVQRGRGGGLAGALGGMGGSSAFGAKAGDIFTRITIVAAAIWIILCIAAAKLGPASAGSRLNLGTEAPATQTGPKLTPPVDGEKEGTAAASKEEGDTKDAAADEKSETPAATETAPAEAAAAPAAEAASPAADEAKTE